MIYNIYNIFPIGKRQSGLENRPSSSNHIYLSLYIEKAQLSDASSSLHALDAPSILIPRRTCGTAHCLSLLGAIPESDRRIPLPSAVRKFWAPFFLHFYLFIFFWYYQTYVQFTEILSFCWGAFLLGCLLGKTCNFVVGKLSSVCWAAAVYTHNRTMPQNIAYTHIIALDCKLPHHFRAGSYIWTSPLV